MRSYPEYNTRSTHDDQAWEVNTKMGGMCFALNDSYLEHDEAIAAGEA